MTDVSYEDQQKINKFSRLNLRMNDIEARLTARKRAAEDYEEAGNEIMLLDDETVPFVIGECLAHLPREDVEERLQKLQEEAEEAIRTLEADISKIQSEMNELKTVLYAKFGNSINLEA
ncbi:hypothetical protein Ndes2526B_g06989 [Nannochloris sp. 'desiccata']|nr:hypothetical protein KSW81_004934 [Chlorella desiccata (nom. nud.)]KAH7618085.1 putative prefoldin subunit 4 [Chlorella desiccata (nom. nud.)]